MNPTPTNSFLATVIAGLMFGFMANAHAQLRVVSPNGAERLQAGSMTTIVWTGVPAADTVALSYSIDAGVTWLPIANVATGLQYNWLVPMTVSTRCLLSASHIRRLPPLLVLQPHLSGVYVADFNPDGNSVATACLDNFARIFSSADGSLINTLTGHTNGLISMAFNPSGSRLVTGSIDGSVIVWDPSTGWATANLNGHTQMVPDVHFSADGARVLSASIDNTARLWNAASGALLFTLATSGPDNEAHLTPDGRTVLVTNDTARLFDASTGAQIMKLGVRSGPHAALSPDGSFGAIGNYNFSISIYAIPSGALIRKLVGHGNDELAIRFSHNGRLVASASKDHSAIIWDAATGALLRQLSGHSGPVNDVAFSPDDSLVVTASDDKTIRVWDVATGALKATYVGHNAEVRTARFSPDGTAIVSASFDHTARIWRLKPDIPEHDTSDALWSIAKLGLGANPIDFGRVRLSTTADSTFRAVVANTSLQPIDITGVWVTGASLGDFRVVSPSFSVPAGSSVDVEFTFAPGARGVRTATVEFDSDRDTAFTTIRGIGILDVLGAPTSVTFADAYCLGARETTAVVFHNPGDVSVTINSGTITAPVQNDYRWIAPPTPIAIAPGDSVSIRFEFTAKREGLASAKLALETTVRPDSEYQLTLNGFSAFATLITDPQAINFGVRLPGTIVDTTVTVTNAGSRSSRVMITTSAPFSVVAPPTTIPAGATANIPVRCTTPTVAGTYTADLSVMDSNCMVNAPSALTVVVGGVLARTIDFGPVLIGAPADSIFRGTLTNSGNRVEVIRRVILRGANLADFNCVTALPLVLNSGQSSDVEFRFAPGGRGRRDGGVEFDADFDTAHTSITGVGVLSELDAMNRSDSLKVNCPGIRGSLPIPIVNSGDRSEIISSITLSGPSSGIFALNAIAVPDTIPSGGGLTVVVFCPSSAPQGSTATLEIVSTAVHGSRISIDIQANLAFPALDPLPADIDFGSPALSSTVDTIVSISNVGNRACVLRLGVNPPFRIVSAPAVIPPGTAAPVTIACDVPAAFGIVTSALTVGDSVCGTLATIDLQVIAGGAAATLAMPRLSARAGDRVRVPVSIVASRSLRASNAQAVRAVIRYDSTLLAPIGGTLLGPGRVELDATLSDTLGEIGAVDFIAALGDTDQCALTIESAAWTNGSPSTTTVAGTFTLLGVCREGATRLFDANGRTALAANEPNPFASATTISFSLAEHGRTRVRIFDLLGRCVATLVDADLEPGGYETPFAPRALPSGTYVSVLETPTLALTRAMIFAP